MTKRSPQLLEQLKRLNGQGLSDVDIAGCMDVHPGTVRRWRHEAGIAPWTPVRAQCGTTSRYVAGCRCSDCRAAWRGHMYAYQERLQASIAQAPAYGDDWTPAQDAVLTNPELGTLAERARRLGRTYYAARTRLTRLRRQEAAQDR